VVEKSEHQKREGGQSVGWGRGRESEERGHGKREGEGKLGFKTPAKG